jgi:hypothetical protein
VWVCRHADVSNCRQPADAHSSTLLQEKYGVDRVVEALHACMWPNMVMTEQGVCVWRPM